MLISIHFPNISLPDLVIPYESVLKHARSSGSLEASHDLMAHLRGEACIFSMLLTQPKLWLHISKPLSVVNSFHTLECMQMASLYVKSNQKLNPWVRLLCMCGRLLQTSSILLVLSPKISSLSAIHSALPIVVWKWVQNRLFPLLVWHILIRVPQWRKKSRCQSQGKLEQMQVFLVEEEYWC